MRDNFTAHSDQPASINICPCPTLKVLLVCGFYPKLGFSWIFSKKKLISQKGNHIEMGGGGGGGQWLGGGCTHCTLHSTPFCMLMSLKERVRVADGHVARPYPLISNNIMLVSICGQSLILYLIKLYLLGQFHSA